MSKNETPHLGFASSHHQPQQKQPVDCWSRAAHKLWQHNRHQDALKHLQQEIDHFPTDKPPRQQSDQCLL